MKNKIIIRASSLSLALVFAITSCTTPAPAPQRNVAGVLDIVRDQFKELNAKSGYAENFGDVTTAKALDSKTIAQESTTGKLQMTSGEVIIDNDASFDSKIEMIRNAKESIRLTYFIYTNDDSSSYMTSELIKKAQQGVKVKILVDFITNYSRIDLFQMMVNEGRGNIQVRFYNFPTERIQSDAKFVTLPCPKSVNPDSDECLKFKTSVMKDLATKPYPLFAKMFLIGMYGRSGTAMKVSAGLGAQLDVKDFKSDEPTSDEDKEKLLEFLKLYYEAKIKNDITSMIKLTITMMLYGDTVNPIVNQITGRLPVSYNTKVPGAKTTHGQEWDHITDYTHHKLLAVDSFKFQLGGRNIEDSYHMKERVSGDGKYIFMDTDFKGTTTPGGIASIEKSFDDAFNLSEMVADITKVQALMPSDFLMNSEALGSASSECLNRFKSNQIKSENLSECVEIKFKSEKDFKSSQMRIEQIKKDTLASADRYMKLYAQTNKKRYADNWKMQEYTGAANRLSAQDLKTAEIYYIENTAFNVKEKTANRQKRRVGSRIGAESFFNKKIHKLWYRGLENACYVSSKEKRDVRVILHSAYLFLPSGLVHKIAKMINGDYGNCSRVHLTLLTNSFETTDLSVINVFARYQLAQMFKHYQALKTASEAQSRIMPKLDYYEYNAEGFGAGKSLHSKVSVLGDDVIIGSANADVRSYAMDSNNAVLIRNAHEFNKDYIKYVDSLLADKTKTKELTQKFVAETESQMKLENDYILGALICKWDKTAQTVANCGFDVNDSPEVKAKAQPVRATQIQSQRFPKAKILSFLATLDVLGNQITTSTQALMNFRAEFNDNGLYFGRPYGDGADTDFRLERQYNKIANDFDDLFKLL